MPLKFLRGIALAILICVCNISFAQTIQINNLSVPGAFGQRSSISCPITTTGCFNIGNKFNLYISDASGNFTSETLIGTFDGFFTTFINGNIPAGATPSSNYKLRVKSTNPVAVSAASNNFEIVASSQTLEAKATAPTSRILQPDLYYGWCSQPQNNATLNLTNASTASATVTSTLKNEITNAVTNPTLNSSNQFPLVLNTHYYTFTVTSSLNNIYSTRSYFIINSPNNLGLATSGEQRGCLPDTLSFNIVIDPTNNGIGNNFPGTMYSINWGDGSSLDLFKHCDLIASNGVVKHLYSQTSCTSPNISFDVTTKLINPFYDSTGTQVQKNCENPVVISKAKIFRKPIADFTFPSPVCINTSVTFTNTSTAGQAQNGSNCTTGAYYTWYINNQVVYQSSNLETTPPNLTHTFTAAGSYTIKLEVDNSSCNIVTKESVICVQPVPVPDFKMNGLDSLSGCAPLTVNLTNTTNSSVCGSPIYLWQVLDSNRNIISSGTRFVFINPTNSGTFEPIIRFDSTGKYFIRLSVTNSCGTFTRLKPVVVLGVTDVSFPANRRYCGKDTIIDFASPNHAPLYNVPHNNNSTYSWQVSGGGFSFAGGTLSTDRFPKIRFTDYGTYTVSVTYFNGCGIGKTVSQQITFDQPVTSNAGPDTTVCFNAATIQLTGSSTGPSGSVLWSGTTGGTFSNANAAITTYTFSSTDKSNLSVTLTYTVTPTAGSACTSVSDQIKVTILPENKITNASPKTICSGTAFSYTPTATYAPSTFTYTSTVTSGNATGNTPNGTGNINDVLVNTSSTVDAVVTYTVTPVKDGCTGTPSSFTVTVKPQPNITSATSVNPSSCGGSNGSISLSGLIPSTSFTVTYTKNGGNPTTVTITSNSSGVVVISNLTSGVYSNISVSSSPNNCTSNIVGPLSLSDPNPPATPTASANGPLCTGQTLNLTASSTTAGVSYTWSGPNSYSSTTQNPTISITNVNQGGTYSVTATLAGCTSAAGTVNVVVNQTPATPTASNNGPICTGSTINLTSNSTTSGVSYTWTGPSGFTSSNQNPSITNATTAASGTYTVTATLGSCTSAAATTAVTVRPTPVISSSNSTNPTNCNTATGSIILNGLANNTTYSVNYTKNGTAQTASITTNASGTGTIQNLTAGVYDNVTVTLNACASNAVGPFTLVDPNPPATPVATSNGPICAGSTLNLLASTSTTGTVTYTWSGPNSFTSTQQNPTITNATIAANGTYNVSVTQNGCTSAAGSVTVVVNPTPEAPTAGSNSPVCSGNTINLTASTNFTGTVTWAWTGPNSFTSAQQNPTIPNASTTEAGTYSVVVTATNGSCASPAKTVTVVVNPTPNISSAAANNPTSCNSATGSIQLNGLTTGSTYQVNYTKNGTPVTATITANTSGAVIINNLTSGFYDNIRLTIAGCPSNTVGPYTLVDPNPPAAPVATSNGPICAGTTLNLEATTTTQGTVSYTWSGPNGFTSAQQKPSIANATIAANGTYNVTVTQNGCTSAAGSVTVVVNATPAAPTAGSNSPVCSGNAINLTATTNFNGAVTYAWTGPNGFTSAQQNPTIANASSTEAGTYSVIATATTGNCASPAQTVTVVVNPTPTISSATATNPTNCNSATGTIQLNGLTANTTYQISYTKNGTTVNSNITTTATGAGTITGLTAGVYDNIKVTLTGCPSNTVGPYTLVDPNPPATPVATSNGPICAGSTLNLQATTTTSGTVTYTWSGPNGFSSTDQNPTIANATTAAGGTYSVTVTQNSCTSAAGSISVVVHATPVAPTAGSNSPVCTGNPLNLTATTNFTGAVTWAWTGPNGFTSNQQNPSIPNTTTAAAGTYSVTATATTGNCASPAQTVAVVINPTPNISSATPNNPTNCNTATGSIELNGLTAGAVYQVNYTKNGTAVTASVTANSSGIATITSLTSGVYDNIRVTLTGCPSNQIGPYTLSDPNPPVAPVATSNGPICAGNTLNLQASTTTAGAVTYLWSGPNGFASADQNPSINNASTAASGTYSVTATLASCTSAAGTVSVVVNATPAAPVVSSNSPVCTGNTLNLTSSTNFSGGITYAWTGPNGFTSTLQNPSIPNTTTAEAGDYILVITANTGSCPSPQSKTTVVINPTPAITGSSFTDPTNCNSATGTITLNGLTAGSTYTVNYSRGGTSQSATITANPSGNVIIPNLPAGVYSNISVTLTGCPSNVVGPITLTDPNPPAAPVATSNSPVCSGDTLRLNATSTSSGALTFAWSGPNGFTSNAQNPIITNVTTAATGMYSVTVTLNSCTSAAGTVDVVINQTPATPVITTNSPVCTNDTLFLKSTTAFNGAVTWSWTGPNGFTSTQQNNFIANTVVANAGTYSVVATATTGNCPSAPGTAQVVINPTPYISSSAGSNPTNCNTATGSITLNGLTANTAYTVNYLKNGTAQTVSLTASATGVLVIPNLTSGTYSNISVTLTGCPSNVVGPFTLVDPNPPVTPDAASNSPLCSGNTLNLTASSVTPGNLTYAWTGPNGFSSSQQNPAIPNVTTAATGTYSVTVTLNNCVSPAGTVNVIVNATPAAPTVSSNSPICAGSTLNITSTTTFTGALTYSWTGPNNFTSNVQNPSITNATTAATGTYTLTTTANQGSCPSPAASVQVVVHPELVNTIDTAAKTICYSQPVTVTGTQPTGGNGTYTFQWEQSTDNINWVSLAGQTGQSITLIPSNSIYLRRRVSSSPCQSFSLSAYITVQPPVTNNNVQQDQSICINTAAAILIGSVPQGANGIYNYRWEQSIDGINWTVITGATGKDYNPGILTSTIKYRRIVTTDLCDGPQSNTSTAVTITVNPDAKATMAPTQDSACAPFVITPSIVNYTPHPERNSNYEWYANNVLIGIGNTFPGYTIRNSGDTVIIKLKAISKFGCLNDSVSHIFFTITKPQPVFAASDTVGCGPLTVSFTNQTPRIQFYKYHWNFGNGQTSNLANPAPVTYASNPTYGDTTYTVSMTVYSQCDTLTVYKTIRVQSKPKALFAPDKTIGCSPMTVIFRNTSKGLGVSYKWLFGDGATLSTNNQDPVQHTYITAVQDTFYAKLVATNICGSDTMTYAIVVSPNTVRLDFAVNGNEATGCKPHAVQFINNSSGATSFRWDFGDGNVLNTNRNIDTVTHVYNQTGTFIVKVLASNGCSDTSSTETIKVFAKPVVDFAFAPSPICIGDSIQFTNQADTITGLTWKFGDGNTSNTVHPKYRYAAAGSYTVTLIGVRQYAAGNACIDSVQKTVTVLSSLPGRFTVSDSVSSCVPFTVTFTNQTYPSVLTTWDFGNGRRDTGNIVTHTFTAVGSFNVRMTANTAGGCSYVMNKPIVVNGPAGTFTYDNGTICGSTPVRFQVVATGTDSIRYNFGDGTIITTNNRTVYHTYAIGGNYIPTITLIAGAGGSCRVPMIGADTIKVDIVKAGFREAMTKECGSTMVAFTDTSRATRGLTTWSWRFGNNNTSSVQHPNQTYTSTNHWPVQLIVRSNSGCSDTLNKVVFVKVNNIPITTILADTTGCVNQAVNYRANIISQDSIGNYQWTFSNGAVSNNASFNNYYATTGTYNARLIATTIYGCSDTTSRSISISPTPTVRASDDKMICRGQSVQLNVTGAPMYSWGPLYGLTCYDCPNPIANPTTSTAYEVAGTNAFGCTAKDTVNIKVVQPFSISVSGRDTLCIGQSTQLTASGAFRYVWFPSTGLNRDDIATPIATPLLTTRYRVIGYDQEGCFTDTAYITVAVGEYPTVDLGPDKVLSTGTLLPLASVVTNGPITKWQWTPTTDLSCSTCALPVATIKKDITYKVVATNAYHCSATDTINIKVFCESTQVFVPNLFTPDHDGVNDVLTVRGTGIKTIKMFRVFNRWGELVFERANFSPNDRSYGWDGTVKGQAAPPDVYVYTCEVQCENDVPYTYKGNVTLIK